MMNWFVKVLVLFAFVGIIVFSAFMVQQQNSNTRASMEVYGSIESALLGDTRINGKDGGSDKKELVANIVQSVTETQKNHGKTVDLKYVFLDVDGNPTTVDEDIDSVQFRTNIINEENEIQSSATKRISLNMVERRTGEGAFGRGGYRVITFGSDPRSSRSRTENISGITSISRIEVDNGNVTYSVSGNNVTVNVSGGVKKQADTGVGGVIPAHRKWIERYDKENYDMDGYKGKLTKYTLSGEDREEHTKFVEGWETPRYDDGSYTGNLERYLAYGEILESEKKYVDGQFSSEYNQDGFEGTLERYLAEVDVREEIVVEIEDHPDEYYETYDGKLIKLTFDYEDKNGKKYYKGSYVIPEEVTYIYKYRGWVEKPELDSRVFLYRGYVTRPALDDREYAYRGWVEKPEEDNREKQDVYSYVVKIWYNS